MTDNVYNFPKSKIVRDVASENLEAIKKMKDKSLKNFADSLTQEMIDNILSDFDNCGVDIDSDSFNKDFVFLSAILSATVYRSLDLPHELQSFIDDTVKVSYMTKDEMSNKNFDELVKVTDKPKSRKSKKKEKTEVDLEE